jgi:hypothetical protein
LFEECGRGGGVDLGSTLRPVRDGDSEAKRWAVRVQGRAGNGRDEPNRGASGGQGAALDAIGCLYDLAAVADASQCVDQLVVGRRLVVARWDCDRQALVSRRRLAVRRLQSGRKPNHRSGDQAVEYARVAHHGEVEQSVAQEVDQFYAAGNCRGHSTSRGGQCAHHLRNQVIEVAGHAKPDLVRHHKVPGAFKKVRLETEQLASRGEQQLARRSDADTPGVPIEETHVETTLEPLDAL